MKTVRRLLLLAVAIGIVAAIYFAMKPQPIKVDLTTIGRGTLQVTVNEDGKTRIKERYVISAPLAGRLLRVDIDPGDLVKAKDSELATIEPTDPQLLNPRELASAEAREKAAEASLKRADPALESAKAELQFAESELARIRKIRKANAISESKLQQAERAYRISSERYRSAAFAQDIARFELEQAQAALVPSRNSKQSNDGKPSDWRFKIESPIDGKVLRVFQESSAVVAPGAPLLEVGDPTDLELEIDVLSSDAVQIRPGQNVTIQHWGGDANLQGVVRLVEPSAFTKISALGVEEQRVNAIIDIVNPVKERETLGDGFRVEVKIIVWEGADLLVVPMSCLFREDSDWMVFLEDGGIAKKQKVEIGHRNAEFAEIHSGLSEGNVVIMHPGDNIADGVAIIAREP